MSDLATTGDVRQRNALVVQRFYDLLTAGDIDGAVALFREGQILWKVPGHSPLAGEFENKDDIRTALRRWASGEYGTFSRDMHCLCSADDDDHVYAQYVLSRTVGESRNRVGVIDAWHVRDGELAHVWSFIEDLYKFDRWTAESSEVKQ
jgi:ketosteroid isomerase-like protein